jgi:hypothetical protein
MDNVVFGNPASEAEIDKGRRAFGNRCAGSFDRMPPHTLAPP